MWNLLISGAGRNDAGLATSYTPLVSWTQRLMQDASSGTLYPGRFIWDSLSGTPFLL